MPEDINISRREFLKLAGLSLMGMVLLPRKSARAQNPSLPVISQGRVIFPSINMYDRPSFEAEIIKRHWQDALLPITLVTLGEDSEHFNRVWYRIGNEGYVHSGGVQPVAIRLNPPVAEIPPEGALAEITVPYTDAHLYPGKAHPVTYRFYYQTTCWVTALVPDEQGNPWYRVLDDLWERYYYMVAAHLRLVPEEELTPLSPDVPQEAKRLVVDTQKQLVKALEYDRPVFMARAATGAKFSNGDFSTPAGDHIIFHKRPSRHMAAGNLAANGYDLPGVPWVSYFTENGVAFHGTYWHNNYGRPRSHGCVNLTPAAAKWVYRWSLPRVPAHEQRVFEYTGTMVSVYGR